MNKHIDQSELGAIVAKETGTDQNIVDAFIKQLFIDIESELISNPSTQIEELGTFKIIKSGSSNRILFLGNAAKKIVREERNRIITNPIAKREHNTDKGITASAIEKRLREDAMRASQDSELLNKNINSETDRIEDALNNNIIQTNSTINGNKESQDIPSSFAEKVEAVRDSYRNRQNNNNNNNNSRTNFLNNRDSNSTTKRSKSNKRIILEILSIFAIIVFSYFIYAKVIIKPETKLTKDSFTELENRDKQNYSCIIITDSDISLKYLAKIYYDNESFWPYIYKANENIVDRSLTIQARSIIKIPKLIVDLVSFRNGELDAHAKILEDEISQRLD